MYVHWIDDLHTSIAFHFLNPLTCSYTHIAPYMHTYTYVYKPTNHLIYSLTDSPSVDNKHDEPDRKATVPESTQSRTSTHTQTHANVRAAEPAEPEQSSMYVCMCMYVCVYI